MRLAAMILCLATVSGSAWATNCDGSVEVKRKFSNAATADTFVVESFGQNCRDAKLLIYVKTAESGWHALHIGELENFSGSGSGLTPATLPAALKEIASRIEPGRATHLESWAQLERAGQQPGGMPWRGTPMTKAEYERVLKARPRTLIVPTDAARGKLMAWDGGGYRGRPIDFVYYGD